MTFGCSGRIDKSRVIGAYVLKVPNASDEIELQSAGSYSHKYKDDHGKEVVATDSWQFETVEGDPTVTLHNFKCNVDGVNPQGKGYFLLKVTTHFGKCRLWADADGHVFFQQTEESGNR
jgi:hypothetical protein